VLNVLTEEEIDGFTRYLQAFYERQDIARRVWAYLRGAHPFDKEKELEAQTVFAAVFPEEATFKYRKLMDALSDLYLWLEEYLAWQFIKQNKEESDRCLAQVFKAKGVKTFFKRKVLQWKERITLKKAKDIWDYNQLIEVNYLLYYHLTADNLNTRIEYVQDLMSNLDQFFLAAKLKFGCELINRSNLYQEEHTIYLLEESLTRIAGDSYGISPLHQGYEKIVRLLQNMDDDYHYYDLKILLENNTDSLAREDKVQLLGTLISYTAKKIRLGESKFNTEALDLYKYGWENNILDINGHLAPVHFFNIVDLACKLSFYEWAEAFIVAAISTIETDHQRDVTHLAYARIAFEQKQFKNAEKLLSQLTNYENDYYALRARLLLLCTLFEINKKDGLIEYTVKAFKQQLKRNTKLDAGVLKSCLAFCDIFTKLNKPKWNKTQLQNRLETQPLIAYKSWLLEKIKEK